MSDLDIDRTPLKSEASTLSTPPEKAGKGEGSDSKPPGAIFNFTPPSRIAVEHNYAKLVPFRSSPSTGNKDSSLSTIVLFPDKVGSKPKKKMKVKRQPKQSRVKSLMAAEESQSSHGEASEGEFGAQPMDVESRWVLKGAGQCLVKGLTNPGLLFSSINSVPKRWRISLMSLLWTL